MPIVNNSALMLVNLPPWGVDTPPLGTACLSTYLKQKGIEAEVLDLNIKLYNKVPLEYRYLWSMNYSHLWRQKEDFKKFYREFEHHINSLLDKIIDSSCRVIGFSLPTDCSDMILKEIVTQIKDRDPSKIVILGGVSVSIKEQRIELIKEVKDYVDYCVVGEGEEALYELALTILNKRRNEDDDIEGMLDKKSFMHDKPPTFVKSLDRLPIPVFDGFELNEYKIPNSILIEFSRGCIGNCPFCDFRSISPRFRSKSTQHILNHIKLYKEKYNTTHLTICDAAVNGNIRLLEELCDLLIKDNMSIDMSALAIPRKEMTEGLLNKMRQAGFYRLEYGLESGSNEVLRAMRKIFTAEAAEKVIRETYKAGIKTCLYLMSGYPGETEKEHNKTKEFLKRNTEFISMIRSINPLHIMAGSEIFYNRESYNVTFPEHKKDSHWFIGCENTVEIRKGRVRELKEYATRLNIPFTEDAENLEFTSSFLGAKKEKELLKKTKTLLVICPMWDVASPPLGISYLASYLEQNGIPADILDLNIELYTDSDSKRKELWNMNNYSLWGWDIFFEDTRKCFDKDIDYYVDRILKGGYEIIGFSLYGANTLFSAELAARLKRKNPGLFIIFGGSTCSFTHDDPGMPLCDLISFKTHKPLIEQGVVDVFVTGEGEKTLYDLTSLHYSSGEISSIPGIFFYSDGRYIKTSDPMLIKELDSLPYPAWEKLSLDLYLRKEALPILFSRGCINRCAFCNDWRIWQERYRCRSALNIFDEMKVMAEKFGRKVFQCNDLLLNGNLKMLNELADRLIESNLGLIWSGQGVIRKDMELGFLKKLRKSGLLGITYGVESLSDSVLKRMNKKHTFNDVKGVLKDTKKAGIETNVNFITGFPTETEEDFNTTKDRLALIREYVDRVSSLNPCVVTFDSDLHKDPQKFSIDLTREGGGFYWESLQGRNTFQARKRRAKELAGFAKRLGIESSFIAIYEGDDLLCEIVRKRRKKREEIRMDKSDFLLVNLPPWSQENPHIGIAYLGSYLRKAGLKMDVLDLNKRFYLEHPDFKMLWHVENKNYWSNKDTFPLIVEIFKEEIDDAVDEALSYDCGILGFSVVDPKERLTIEFIKRIKEKAPNKKIILGGPATSTHEQRKIFADNIGDLVDTFVIGEGEETLYHLLDNFLNKKEADDIRGCFLRHNGGWNCKDRAPIRPLDNIPFPTYEEFDLKSYGKSLLVEWSRGCRGRCAFCKNYRLFPTYRSKSADWVVSELRHHKERYNIEEFTVVDNILNGDLKRLSGILRTIERENLDIRWTGQIAPHRDMDLGFFKNMKRAGCSKLQIGLESASNKVLRLMKKTFTQETSERNIRLAKKAGIETEIFIMVGFPGETERDFKKTCNFVKRNRRYIDTVKSINTPHLIAGTEIYEDRDKFKIKPLPKDNWHYLWETHGGNNYHTRKERAERLLDLTCNSGIKVMETNVREGKERAFELVKDKKKREDKMSILRTSIDSLQELPKRGVSVKIRRSLFKHTLLACVSLCTFCYIVYFNIFMIIRRRAIFGGGERGPE
ncbi:MAG: radical SAM protein [Candidatus Omnitrophica bacterium]|nr:radical SAM protein [Candidatus Omnitrophota bacterium]